MRLHTSYINIQMTATTTRGYNGKQTRRNMFYTVTATVTTFIRADYASQAEDMLYEALLGNDPKNVLGLAEVHMPVTSQRGVHSTIPVNEDIKPTLVQSGFKGSTINMPEQWEKTLGIKKQVIKNEKKETELDTVAMQSATIRALTDDRDKWHDMANNWHDMADKWRGMADCLADAIQDLHHMIPSLQAVTEEYLDLCDEFFGTDNG